MYCDYFESPLGLIEFKASQQGLTQVIFCGATREASQASAITDNCKLQLNEYFSGLRISFDLPLDPQGTEFQKLVWRCLSQIPFGEVVSYKDIAKMVNRPKGSQAVGGANGRNPISIIVPCHRVIGSNGALTGYAGGLERKLWLLNHEGVMVESAVTDPLKLGDIIATRQAKTEFLN